MSRLGKVYRILCLNILNEISRVLAEENIESMVNDEKYVLSINSPFQLRVVFKSNRHIMGATIRMVYLSFLEFNLDSLDGSTQLDIRSAERNFMLYIAQKGFTASSQAIFKSKNRPQSKLECELIQKLNDLLKLDDLNNLIKEGGVKSLVIIGKIRSENLTIILEMEPIAGVITVVYFPPVPPFLVKLNSREIKNHYRLMSMVLEEIARFFTDHI